MRLLSFTRSILLTAFISALFSCNEKEEFVTENMSDYVPLAAGKYITYRLDSMVFTHFNNTIEIHKYQVKHVIDALVTDNLGRASYRVFRFLRDSAGLTPWEPNGTYFITPLSDQLEVIEDNLRFIKLHMPLKQDFSWKGNRYLPTGPYGPLYTFSNDDNMEAWDYYYESLGKSLTTHNQTYSNVCTVEEIDEGLNIPVTLPNAFGYRSRALEKYSKDIGLVYREYTMYEYQPDPAGGSNNTYHGFGITMWMIDHN